MAMIIANRHLFSALFNFLSFLNYLGAQDSAIGAGDLRFNSRIGSIKINRQLLTTAATFLWNYVAQTLSRKDGPSHSLHASA